NEPGDLVVRKDFSDCLWKEASLVDFGLWPVATIGDFFVPFSIGVLVADAVGGTSDMLLGGSGFGSLQRLGVTWKGFRIGGSDLVGPAAVMLDDGVGEFSHCNLQAELLRNSSLTAHPVD